MRKEGRKNILYIRKEVENNEDRNKGLQQYISHMTFRQRR